MAKIDLDLYEKIIFRNLLNKDSVFLASCVEYLDKSLFKDKDIGEIVHIIKTFYLERDAIPNLTEIKGRLTSSQLKAHYKAAIEHIKDLDKDYNETELVKNTEYFLKQRSCVNLLDAAALSHADKKEVDYEEIQRQVERINAISLIDNLGLDFFAENHRIIEYLQKKDNLISTGYKGFDGALGGIQREGRAFYCIGGETNIGKSIVLGNIATNFALQDLNIIIYTLEMSEMRYAKRISGMLTGIAISQLTDKIDDYKEFIRDFVETHKSKIIIKEFAAKSVSAKTLYAYTRNMMRKKKIDKLDGLFFDYHPLLKASVAQPSKHGEMQYITQECRGMTYLLEAPGLSVAQLNRGAHKNERPGLDNASGSWDMISDVDGWATIAQSDVDREANIIRYYGDKVRDDGKGKSGQFTIDYNTLRLSEHNDDDEYSPDDLPSVDLSQIDFAE